MTLPMTIEICTRGAVVSMETAEECNFQLSNMNLLSRDVAMYCDISARRVHAACSYKKCIITWVSWRSYRERTRDFVERLQPEERERGREEGGRGGGTEGGLSKQPYKSV